VSRQSAELPPLVPWATFYRHWRYELGEHVTAIGPTGTGKTTLLRALLVKPMNAGTAVAVLATKPRDKNLDRWAREDGLTIVREWPPSWPWWKHTPPNVDGLPWDLRVMCWPQPVTDKAHVRAVHRAALEDTFEHGNRIVVAEELLILCDILGLDDELVTDWTQGRSNGVGVWGGSQRPTDIPLYAYSSATHLFFFGDSDEVNLKRIQGLGGLSGDRVRETVRALPHHDVLYVNTRRRVMVRTRVEA
jgi:energy-coupling factor transporter ATP-binding protein EcfA2